VKSETARFLAFGITHFVANPSGTDVETFYIPSHSEEEIEVNLGKMICEIVYKANLAEELVFTEAMLLKYLSDRGLTPQNKRFSSETTMQQLARRLERLQRRLMIEPPILAVNRDKSEIVLWNPANASSFGDIKPDIGRLLEEVEEST
jgi:hypothetical protein